MLKRTHLRQFLATVETGRFTAAARRLNITQPTLSAGISQLERLVGAPLFLRERKGVHLTEAGNRLLAHARAIEREFRTIETDAPLGSAPSQPLRLGVLASLSSVIVARLCAAYAGEQPLALTEGMNSDLRRLLGEGRLDAALVLLRTDDGAGPELEEGYAMMLASGHRLAGSHLLTPEVLASETMIARRSCEILSETSRFFTRHGVRPRFILRSGNDERCMALVRAGAGITTAPLSLTGAGVAAVPVAGYDFRRRVGLIGPAHGERPPELMAAWADALVQGPAVAALPIV